MSIVRSDRWIQPETSTEFAQDRLSNSGQFLVVWYAARSTSPSAFELDLLGTLVTGGGERFEESADVDHHHSTEELSPREVVVSAMIFDVPADVDPTSVDVGYLSEAQRVQAASVDLASGGLEGVEPDAILAYSWELLNAAEYELAYTLYADDFRSRIPESAYVAGQKDAAGYPTESYAFRSVDVSGNSAMVDRILTVYNTKDYGTYQDPAKQPMLKENGVWKISARPENLEYYADY